jgi:Uncharacterised protein family (UPF0158)
MERSSAVRSRRVGRFPIVGRWRIYPGVVRELNGLDLDEIATALSNQNDYDTRWLVDPESGEIVFWTRDTGMDGSTPVELDELDHLVVIEPLPSYVWYQDMVDFVNGISEERAGRRLGRAIQGRGAFRRFKDELYEEYPALVPVWNAFRDTRARRRAVEWLLDKSLIDELAATRFFADHPDPSAPGRIRDAGDRHRGQDQVAGWNDTESTTELWTVGKWLRFWLSTRASIRASTPRSYTEHVDNHLIPFLGPVRLGELTGRQVTPMFTTLAARPNRSGRLPSPATLHRIRARCARP